MSDDRIIDNNNQGRLNAKEFFSLENVFTIKNIAVMGLLLAIRFFLGLPFMTIYVMGVKIITFAYLCDAITAMLFGPWAAILFGFAGDTLGYIASMSTGGAYMPVFAISEMMTGFIFALFLYKRKVAVKNVIIAWILNLFIVILGLNSLWLILMFGMSAGKVLTLTRFGINLLQFPVHVALTYFILKAIRNRIYKL